MRRSVEVLGVGVAGEARARPIGAGTDVASQAERDAWAILQAADGLGPIGFDALLRRFGSGVAIVAAAGDPGAVSRLAATPFERTDDGEAWRTLGPVVATATVEAVQRADRTLERIRALGLQVVTTADAVYPRRLGAIDLPPPVLFVLGSPAALDARCAIAVVGTRRPTEGGRSLAARLAGTLVSAGATVVSGLATGIDGSAHAAAVHAGGTTVAVIGSGHAQLFPKVHARLAASIVASGGAVVSELAPDILPTRGTFPRRNRVISGLADATVVVEAPLRSGALITASWALEQGRECFLVPGPLDAVTSAGCLVFLRDYAGSARIVAGISQLIEDLGLADHLAAPSVSRGAAATLLDVPEAARQIGNELLLGRVTVDQLVASTGWPVASVLAALTVLEGLGLAVGIHGRFRPAGTLASEQPKEPVRPSRRLQPSLGKPPPSPRARLPGVATR